MIITNMLIRIKGLRRGNTHYGESRNRKEAAYVSADKNVWYRHGNMRTIDEMENEQVLIVMKGKDEFHTRLRFCRRDLIAMANFGKDDNGSQFFFTLNSTPDLQNKHTILDENDRPFYPPRMIKTIILNNPFSDIISRIIVEESEEVKDNSKTKTAGVKYKSYMFAEFRPDSIILCNEKFCYRDFNLLSFGKEAEEDNEESVILSKKFRVSISAIYYLAPNAP
ncbi:Peptidyl-prolyl isomerase cwc27 [Eufriesea mexicana]|uniref:Spliceosome-associated protein CWC27 homolog n=1 Tax=Eufriesea mexicana TaxID=516756 RepID=A0A310SH25_9HYME|nr:Peptidyl-prolyl isomerase cwc27 [Eufriesea mexicana]